MQQSQWKKWIVLTCFSVTQVTFSSCFGEISGKEALALRRIVEFWKDKDLKIAQKQILDFLHDYPESPAIDQLHTMLGDLYFEQKNYEDALATYAQISDASLKEKTLFPSLYSLFQLRDFPAVIALSELYFNREREGQEALDAHALVLEALVHTALKTPDNSEQTALTEKALTHFQHLDAVKEPHLLFFLAEIQRILKKYPEAICTYSSLAEKYPEKKEDLLFQAARLQVLVDKDEAIKTFDLLAEGDGKTNRAAAFNELILLFETKRYEEFISLFLKRSLQVPENKAPLLQLYLGKCHYALAQYSQACAPLLNYIYSAQGKTDQMKTALICLIDSAYMIKDLPTLKESITQMQTHFPKDAYYPQALLFRAHLYLEKKEYQSASSDMDEIRNHFPNFGNREELLFTSAYLTLKLEKWEESHRLFQALLEEFPTSAYGETARRHLVSASLKLNDKEMLIVDLFSLLKGTISLPLEEKRELHLFLAKTLYEVASFASAIEELDLYLKEYPEHLTVGEAHLLAALCYHELFFDDAFIDHAEKALSFQAFPIAQKGLLHLHLYNAYLKLKNEEKAAQHLLSGLLSEEASVKMENQIWLAEYLYQKSDLEQAMVVFEKIFKSKQPEPALEALFLKYTSLLHSLERYKEEIDLLKILVHFQENQSDLPWNFQRRSLFELAKAHEVVGENGLALILYDNLIHFPTFASSYIGTESLWRRARLEFQLLKEEEKDENDPHCIAILNSLKELQIKKNVQSEPIHIEAALDYAEIRSALAPENKKQEKLLFFLNRVKDDFSSEDDIVSKEYMASRKEFAEKDALFQTYMRYLEAKIMSLEGRKAEAKEECRDLISQPLHPYLKERIKKILNDD
jgi:TolA-binding protein